MAEHCFNTQRLKSLTVEFILWQWASATEWPEFVLERFNCVAYARLSVTGAMDRWTLLMMLSTVTLLRRTETATVTVIPSRPPTTVTESTDCVTVHVVGGATTPGVVDITHEDVERSLQQNEAVIIDVRNFDEAATLGQIPTSNVLPGCTT